MRLFFHPNPIVETFLNEEESLHAVKVLRLKEHDELTLVDGKGLLVEAKISTAHPKKCAFTVVTFHEQQRNRSYRLHLAIAPTKSIDRMEWLVEKAIEIGVDEISFLVCERSERKTVNMERMEKIAISAMKQSMNLFLPTLNATTPFSKFVSEKRTDSCFIAHLEEGQRKIFKNEIVPYENILILIGPEGDFTLEEIKKAIDNGYKPVSLGDSRLRTETAGLAACFICNTIKQ